MSTLAERAAEWTASRPVAVTRAVAELWPWTHWGTCIFCQMMTCFPAPVTVPINATTMLLRQDIHAEECPWRVAREWVLNHPDAEA